MLDDKDEFAAEGRLLATSSKNWTEADAIREAFRLTEETGRQWFTVDNGIGGWTLFREDYYLQYVKAKRACQDT